jgi:hypothetical protein
MVICHPSPASQLTKKSCTASMPRPPQREERTREEMPREYLYLSGGGPLCTEQAASTVYSVLRSDAVQNILCWLACSVHDGPPSPQFQILPSQLRQTADRAAGLSIKGLWTPLSPSISSSSTVGGASVCLCKGISQGMRTV